MPTAPTMRIALVRFGGSRCGPFCQTDWQAGAGRIARRIESSSGPLTLLNRPHQIMAFYQLGVAPARTSLNFRQLHGMDTRTPVQAYRIEEPPSLGPLRI